jgi:hypothetical protein
MTKVAVRYKVSGSFLARVCERLNVPRPARGYWAQLEVGKAPTKPSLPDALPGDEIEWARGAPSTRRAPRALPKPPERIAAAQTPQKVRHRGPHPLIEGARGFFDGSREAESGHLRPTKRRLVDLYVSSAALDRALAFAKKLFRTLENLGHRVALAPLDRNLWRPSLDERSDKQPNKGRDNDGYGRWSPDRPTVVYVGTVAIALTVFEVSEEIEVGYTNGKYVPVRQLPIVDRIARGAWNTKRHMASGKLCLRASSPYGVANWERLWREARKGELSSKIPAIASELGSAAGVLAKLVEEGEQRAEERRREWERQQEVWRQEAAERRRLQNIKESREQLASIIAAWGEAMQIEAFFEDTERRAEKLEEPARYALVDRVRRARELLGGVDALGRFGQWKSPEERGE